MSLLHVGSTANNGSICGLSASNANDGFGNSNANNGARLTFSHSKNIEDTFHSLIPRNWEITSIMRNMTATFNRGVQVGIKTESK